ncbi:uncharacterized protein B0H18DRAFT_820240, partial [Fomitopsis serialis]|uniref:uncharacterized protein n=1 Tax=Fomitopsis serialis TaxID=139415 RepID=UPI002008B24C
LLVDPNGLEVPDYALEAHAALRQSYVDAGLAEANVVPLLKSTWTRANDADKLRWQVQTEAAERVAREQAAAEEEAANQVRAQDRLDEEQARRDERKKYKDKFSSVSTQPPPEDESILPAKYALRKLEKGSYVELYYFTNEGLDTADASANQFDEDALVVHRGDDGVPSWAPAGSARGTKNVTADQDLTLEQFRQATPRLLGAM